MHEHRIRDFRASIGVITCSNSRTEETDDSGRRIRELVTEAGHKISGYFVVRDEENLIIATVRELLPQSDAIIISGGTGITVHDVTIDAVSSIAEYELTGFGRVFSFLSYGEIGSSAILSRATAFVVERKPVFCLPGSPQAAALGVSGLILDQIDHFCHELSR